MPLKAGTIITTGSLCGLVLTSGIGHAVARLGTESWSSNLSSIPPMQPSRDISRLLEIMAALRNPDGGCPWDLAQDFASIRHYTIEEAYEVADAIEREDFNDLREELGDLLLQPVFHAQMASEAGLFDFGDVVQAITEKLVRRHPHVFGEQAARDAGRRQGPLGRRQGRRAGQEGRRQRHDRASILDDVRAHPASAVAGREADQTRCQGRLRLADTGATTLGKVNEELTEVTSAVEDKQGQPQIAEEMGDLLFAVVNLARQLDVDPEAALRDANAKFTRRFHYVEERARQGRRCAGRCRS